MSKYSVLVVGSGGQGSQADAPGTGNEHKIISFGHAVAAHPAFSLIGFVDPDLKKAQKAASVWGGNGYNSFYDFIGTDAIDQPDVFIVATPDDLHFDVLMSIVEHAKPKLVIVEKPVCMDLYEAREVVDAYEHARIPLMVNYTRRFLPELQKLKDLYDMGAYGEAVLGTLIFNRGFVHSASHAVELFEWIGVKHYKIFECDTKPTERVWDMKIFFEHHRFREHRFEWEPPIKYSDEGTWHVIVNAFWFLEGEQALKCTGRDGLKALEICYRLMSDRPQKMECDEDMN